MIPDQNLEQGMEEQLMQLEEDFGALELGRVSSIREAKKPTGAVVSQEVYQVKEEVRDGKSYVNQFEVIAFLGQGAYGKVKKVERSYIDEQNNIVKSVYAIKIYDRRDLAKHRFFAVDMQMMDGNNVLENEINIVKTLDHKNILRCYQIIDDEDCDRVYMVLDLCDLGDLMKFSDTTESYHKNETLVNFFKDKYDIKSDSIEDIAKIIFHQVAQGVQYLHQNNISHRDIKVDNIMVKSEEKGNEVKLGDFTTARYSEGDISNQTIGTVHYKAPEQQFASDTGYSARAADIWSLAITIYLFCFEKFPFTGESELEIDIKSLEKEIEYPETASKEIVDLLQKMTLKDFKKRPSIAEVLADPWFSIKV